MSTNHPITLDGKTFGIGVLGVTACILFVGLMLLPGQPPVQPAYGIGQNDRGGDYILVTQQISIGTATKEGLVVIDAAAKQLIIYAFDISRKELDIIAQVPLDQLPKPRADGVPDPRQQGRRRP